MLDVQHLTVAYGQKRIVDDVSFTVAPGQWLMLVGPNGAGKSTIVNAVSQGVAYEGSVLFGGEDLARCPAHERARRIGVLSQNHSVGYSFTVEEVVRLGRYAYSRGIFAPPPVEDKERVRAALEATGLLPLAGQSVLTLSGGELQRTFLAQLLAQDPQLLLLDEPTNHLDLIYQKQIFALVREWIRQAGRAVVSVVHDLSLARTYGTHAILLNGGHVVAQGTVEEVFTREKLREVYGLDVYGWMGEMLGQWTQPEQEGTPMTIFLSGGCKNGKSTLAEHCACALAKGGPLYYLATMTPHDEEDRTRIRRHVANRAGKGFTTIECGTDILRALDDADLRGTFLLDSVTALLANEMFREDGTVDEDAASRTALALTALAERVGNIVFVSDYLYSDAARYDDDETERYRRALALCDRTLAETCDVVAEISLGQPLLYKGALPL